MGGGAVEAHGLGQIDLADHHHIGAAEHRRVFERLVLPFAGRQQHHPQVFAQVVSGGADEIAHVLDQQPAQPRQGHAIGRQHRDTPLHHRRLQVAGLAGGDWHGGQTGSPQPLGIEIGGQVSHQHRHGAAIGPVPGQALQQGGLARTGGGEQVEHPHAGRVKAGAVGRRMGIVVLQEPPGDAYLAGFGLHPHGNPGGLGLAAGADAAHGGWGGGEPSATE